MSFFYATDPTVIAGIPAATTTVESPMLLSVGQASGVGVASALLPEQVTNASVASMQLLRTLPGGMQMPVDTRDIDRNSRWMNLFDQSPADGQLATYAVAAISEDGTQSSESNSITYTAYGNPPPLASAGGISAGALGTYPLLGSDVYINPISGEAVIGPNGDLLTVNGLALLGQDLNTRIRTKIGELVFHPDFGLFGGLIGSGQSDPATMANTLRTRVIDAITADAHVYQLDEVIIAHPYFDGWQISYLVYAIGVEDPLRGNLVYPYLNG